MVVRQRAAGSDVNSTAFVWAKFTSHHRVAEAGNKDSDLKH